jgi:hypothetical protein
MGSVIMIYMQDCKQRYYPSVAKTDLNYLSVDGIILNGPDTTIITLSRTQNLTDSNYVFAGETGAQVSVIGENAEVYPLIETGNGRYIAPGLTLNYNETYQLKILTSNGEEYLSDSIPVKQTPPIDSVFYTDLNNALLNFYVTTHDPLNNTHYYRWQFTETWEYQSYEDSHLIYENNTLRERTPQEQIYTCWKSINSTDILVGTSEKLSQDVISAENLLVDTLFVYNYPINIQLIVPTASQKFLREYSLLVNQYAITEEAYNFWQNLKLNTEQVGTLFSPEPSSQLNGNIHCINNPKEPVLGYITASRLQQKRIFLNHYDVFPIVTYLPPDIGCGATTLTPDQINNLSQPIFYTPIDSVFDNLGNFVGISAGPLDCVDCRRVGGVNMKPSYWPN